MDQEADEPLSYDLLKQLLKAVGRGQHEAAHSIRMELAYRLCDELLSGDGPPSRHDIQIALRMKYWQRDLSEADVLSGWYYLRSKHTPQYDVLLRLASVTPKRPEEWMIVQMVTDIIAEYKKRITGLKRKKGDKQELVQEQFALELVEELTVEDVLMMWDVCEAHGVPPFPKVTRH